MRRRRRIVEMNCLVRGDARRTKYQVTISNFLLLVTFLNGGFGDASEYQWDGIEMFS